MTHDLAKRLGLDKETVAHALFCLRRKGAVVHVDRKPGAIRHRGRWTLADQ